MAGFLPQRLARARAAAFRRHPSCFDGIAFASRFGTVDDLALFHDRAAGALRAVGRRRLLDSPVELGRACHARDLAIVTSP